MILKYSLKRDATGADACPILAAFLTNNVRSQRSAYSNLHHFAGQKKFIDLIITVIVYEIHGERLKVVRSVFSTSVF